MGLTSKAKGRLAAALVFAAFAALYSLTLCRGFCPGSSAHSAAVVLGLEPGVSQTQVHRVEALAPAWAGARRVSADPQILTVRTVSATFRARHLVWRATASAAARLPFGALATRLNALSALFGALAVMLAFALGRGLVLFLNFHDSPLSSGSRKASAMAAGVVAALALGLSTPFWLAATRCLPAAFDAFAFLLMGWLLFTAAVSQRPGRLFLFGAVWGVALFESETGPYLALLMFLFALRAMTVGGIMNVRSWCNCLVGIIAGELAYLLLARFTLAGEGTMFLPFRELMESIRIAGPVVFGGGLFDDQAKLASLFFALLPFAATVALAIWHNAERRAAATGFLVFLLACTLAVALTGSSISPWGAYKALYPGVMPVAAFIFAAAVACHLAAAGALMADGRLLAPRRRNAGEDDGDDSGEASVGRLLFWVVFALALGVGALNAREVRDYRDAFVARAADEFSARLGGRAWMTSTTETLDTMVRICSWQRGAPLRIIGRGGDPAAAGRLRHALSCDEAFRGLPRETLDRLSGSLFSTNLNEFVIGWIGSDRDVGRKLLLDAPDLWLTAGRTPVPAVVGYRAMERGEEVDWGALADAHIAFWDAIEAGAEELGPAAPRHVRAARAAARAYFCDIGQNLAEQLVRRGAAAKAREVLDRVEDLRREPEPRRREPGPFYY